MAFEPIKGNRSPGSERTEPDKVYIAVYGSRDESKPNTVTIRIGKEVAERLGWTSDSKIAILEGSEKEAGLLKLVPDAAGYRAGPTNPKKPNGALMLQPMAGHFKYHDFPTLQLGQPVEVQAFGGEMLILLPEWVVRKLPGEAATNGGK